VKTVYLAGPIAGLTFSGCVDWRRYAIVELSKAGIRGLSPMRGKEYLEEIARTEPFTADCDAYAIQGPLSTNRGIMTRDRWDATRCDVLLANFAEAAPGVVSIGTCMEVAWADLKRTPIVAVLPKDNIHAHGMILEAIGYRLDTLEEALFVTKAILA
jgi:nucleoside 2-deoxyribosyltransferase